MRILLIGATGFIGPPVVTALQRLGHDVAVFHRGRHPLTARVHEIVGDRNRLPEFAPAFREFAPDVVVDVILSSGKQARTVRDTFRGLARRIVAVSSIDVYRACGVFHGSEPGPLEPVPLTETSALRTKLQTYPPERIAMLQHVFGWLDDEYDKIPVEREIMADDGELPGTVLRLPMVYGPGDPLHRLNAVVKRIDDGRPIILFERKHAAWRGPHGYVENVGDAIALAATSDAAIGRIYNVAEPDARTELEWAGEVASVAGWHGEFVVLPEEQMPPHLLWPGNLDQHWASDSTRIRAELGYRERVSRSDALRATIAWERANPPATPAQACDYATEDAAWRAARDGFTRTRGQ
jgi:nucleoside-diphosphate-sugar epimerase